MDSYLYQKLKSAAEANESVGLTPTEVQQVWDALHVTPDIVVTLNGGGGPGSDGAGGWVGGRHPSDDSPAAWLDRCESANPDDPSRGPEPR